jgi:hypothetical protein
MSSSNWHAHPVLPRRLTIAIVATLLMGAAGSWEAFAAGPHQRTFASPGEAVQALVEAVKAGDMEALASILGPEGRDLISSGDAVADKQDRARFVRSYEESNKLERPTETKAVLVIGQDQWPLPIPVVKEGETWRFDSAAGKEEILSRRIGRNELSAMQVCLAYVDAQREYARMARESDGVLAYAMKFRSDEGKQNGLYWPTKEGEALSPLGVLVANARAEGYSRKTSDGKPTPYHGYFYRILTAQGPDATGGAYDYVVNGKMIGGFALVAYPAQYGVSGVMTFIVNHEGVVYQKDLGTDTENTARAMQTYNPDSTWKKAGAPPPPTR